MIATMLVLTHFILRKLGLTNCDLPPGWPAYVCTTHEGGARTATTASVSSVASAAPVGAQASLTAATGAGGPTGTAGAPSAATTAAGGKPSVHPIQSVAQAQLEPLAAAIPQPPPCITIPNPPYPGSPCPPSKYPPYEPAAQKMPFVIDNAAPTPVFGPQAGLSAAQATPTAQAAPVGADMPFNAQDKNNCVTITASGVAVPCTPPGGAKKPLGAVGSKMPPGSVAGGKSTLNQPPAVSPSKAAPPPK